MGGAPSFLVTCLGPRGRWSAAAVVTRKAATESEARHSKNRYFVYPKTRSGEAELEESSVQGDGGPPLEIIERSPAASPPQSDKTKAGSIERPTETHGNAHPPPHLQVEFITPRPPRSPERGTVVCPLTITRHVPTFVPGDFADHKTRTPGYPKSNIPGPLSRAKGDAELNSSARSFPKESKQQAKDRSFPNVARVPNFTVLINGDAKIKSAWSTFHGVGRPRFKPKFRPNAPAKLVMQTWSGDHVHEGALAPQRQIRRRVLLHKCVVLNEKSSSICTGRNSDRYLFTAVPKFPLYTKYRV
ncbi:hypothetical protein BJ322DRAFT_1219871 [Thelephora terrestris]|uniref:Uncharacterized protein n=1 Tax=Thelephora terrestris TaxID=56493 RepID=A0A9P6L501_9AGAM|nr:hypothetical protein BJ322DRAFT_1219871 [Thelephora terrestris]